MAVAAVTSCRRLAVSCPQRSRIGHVPLAFSLTPSEEQVYSFLRKIGAFFEAYDRIVVKRIQRLVIQPVGKALSYIPPLSIGFGAGSGCGIGIGWSFAQVQQEGLPSPPKVSDPLTPPQELFPNALRVSFTSSKLHRVQCSFSSAAVLALALESG